MVLFAVLTLLSLAGWIFLRHSFFAVPFVVFVSLWVGDFYPLSPFPMYSDPDESENYLYLASFEEEARPETVEPLPVRPLTRTTSPKVKKMFKSWSDERAAELGIKRKELSPEDRRQIGLELLDFLRDQAPDDTEPLPDRLALVEVWIVYDIDEGLSETTSIIAYQNEPLAEAP